MFLIFGKNNSFNSFGYSKIGYSDICHVKTAFGSAILFPLLKDENSLNFNTQTEIYNITLKELKFSITLTGKISQNETFSRTDLNRPK